MSVRVQVILAEEEAAEFRSRAQRESKSLSAWLREAGQRMLQKTKTKETLIKLETLAEFFEACGRREQGQEPDWLEYKKMISKGFQEKNQS